MAKITPTDTVHVSIVIDGEATSLDFSAGTEYDVPDQVAQLLIAQNFATEQTSKSGKKTTAATVAPEENPIAPLTSEA